MTAALTIEQIEALEELEKAATPGEWRKPFEDGALAHERDKSLLAIDKDGMAIVNRPEDAALIAALRNAAPALLQAARDNADLEQELEEWTSKLVVMRDDRDRLMAALKAEAIRTADGPGDIIVIGGLSFRAELDEATGELTANEVTDV